MTAKTTETIAIRDRIKELRRIPASELQENPRNWRAHPSSQRAAMRGILDEIGYAGALIARETDDGLELIDGHLRKEVTPDQEVPVLIVDLTDEEAKKLLVVLDPVGAMAEADVGYLRELLGEINSDNEAVQVLLEQIANDHNVPVDYDDTEIDESITDDMELHAEWKIQAHPGCKEAVEKALDAIQRKFKEAVKITGGGFEA